ncbi:MAG: glycosyltransferase family 2 protein [Bacteroidetes bacterium]|nr:glycosyltransferase family 2 protein [Bacteroidota bacterium]
MYKGKKIVVVMPAYNAEKTLENTLNDIPDGWVDELVLVDDCSSDKTAEKAQQLGVDHIIEHDKNLGYGGNQKTCYETALKLNADIIIMLHPDYQYNPKLIPAMASLIASGLYDVVFGSRILGKGALTGGMPKHKYILNRLLTFVQNVVMGQKLSEYHTGYRAYSRAVLESLNLSAGSNNFVYDNEMIARIFNKGFSIAEVTCPTKYFDDASSIDFKEGFKYAVGVLCVSARYFLHRKGIVKWRLLED